MLPHKLFLGLEAECNSYQLLRQQQGSAIVTLQGPVGKAQDVLLVALELCHGPVLPLKLLLLSFSNFLYKEKLTLKECTLHN